MKTHWGCRIFGHDYKEDRGIIYCKNCGDIIAQPTGRKVAKKDKEEFY